MSKITDCAGISITSVPKIKEVRPFGSLLLVEVLTKQEVMGTFLHVGDEAAGGSLGSPQAYILAMGDRVGPDAGVKIGDRVLIVGNFVVAPNDLGCERQKGLIEMHNIKAILVE